MKTLKSLVFDWVIPIILAIIIALLINKFLFFKIYVPTSSMYPTIKPGDRIIAARVHNLSKLKRGDKVVFYSKELEETLIKRLIGLPGDSVEIKNDGTVYINGKEYEEPYVIEKSDMAGSFKVPAGEYLFLGDNRADSRDSRYWKDPYIEGSEIKGKALFILFPFGRAGKMQ